MRVNRSEVAPSVGQGRPGTARLMGYILLAIVLMVLDQRGHFVPRIRAALEYLVEPIYHLVELPVSALKGARTYSRSYETLAKTNERQNTEILLSAGRLQRLQAMEDENRRLRLLLDATQGRDFDFQFAELVLVSLDPFSHQVVIDRGATDDVLEGQVVIDGEGVVGQVEHVLIHQSRVRLISDPEHALPVQILRTGQRTVAYGTGDASRLSIPNLPIQSDIREGDRLVTSGLGNRFPAGFPVADIVNIDRGTGSAFATINARPLAALDRGREVLLVVPMTPVGTDEPIEGDAQQQEQAVDEAQADTDIPSSESADEVSGEQP